MTLPSILEVRNLQLSYGQAEVLHGVSLDVPNGAIVAIVGPNGAGKSSTLRAIAGGHRIDAGMIQFEGRPIQNLPPEQVARGGLSFVPEGRHVFASLTVEENLRIGTHVRREKASVDQDFERVLDYFPRLRERLRQPGGKLSGGEQQMLVIGRALMTRPRLILVDEPSLGLAPRIVEDVYRILRTLRDDEGLSILVNEQSSRRVMQFANQIVVLRDGVVQLTGKPRDLLHGHELHDAYFGAGTFDREAGNTTE
jgi:branched-chain amino acid transport system ATP-binding protein